MSKVKEISFTGEKIFCGIDVHKNNWKVNCIMDKVELVGFSQNPDPEQFKKYMDKNYPGAEINAVYEAGFFGFGVQRSLSKSGVNCMVVNAADVPTSDKERKRKDDKRDARKLSRELKDGSLKPLYVPIVEMGFI